MNALEVLNQTRDAMTARRVYGEPYQQDGVTVIPAANVWGGGGGGGDTEGNGGGGFGMVARPAGAWVIKDGEAVWRPAIDVNRIVLMGHWPGSSRSSRCARSSSPGRSEAASPRLSSARAGGRPPSPSRAGASRPL